MSDKDIKEIIKRLNHLEVAVFPKKRGRVAAQTSKRTTSGPKGGILLLISKNFFTTQRTVDEVLETLKKNGYHYHKDVARTALTRLSNKSGPLTAFKDGGVKVFVNRK
ncbi:hypothetical protein LCGC14_2137410 [marine sediment metagenome]|uniref:HTH HARE-type domain-containing protein n=1 Tax=marine sediment metagenome TaxID=412755 RepID=A0A0F9GCH4_9ZZZZ